MEKQTKNINMFNLFSESFLVYLNNLLPAVSVSSHWEWSVHYLGNLNT